MLVNNNNNPTNVTVKSENKKDLQIKYWKSNANCKFHRTNSAKRRKAQEKPAKDCANQRWKIRNTSEKYLNKSNFQWKIRKCEVGTPLKAHKAHCLALSEVKAKCVKNNWQWIKKKCQIQSQNKKWREKRRVCVHNAKRKANARQWRLLHVERYSGLWLRRLIRLIRCGKSFVFTLAFRPKLAAIQAHKIKKIKINWNHKLSANFNAVKPMWVHHLICAI